MVFKYKTKVMFVCIGNMCRSPMAEGFACELGGDIVDAYSAGTNPTGVISEDAIMMMESKGFDISHQRSNGLNDVPLEHIDIAVIMSGYAPERVFPPSFKGKVLEWDVDDPIGRSLATFRSVCDDIEQKVKNLLEDIRNTSSTSSQS